MLWWVEARAHPSIIWQLQALGLTQLLKAGDRVLNLFQTVTSTLYPCSSSSH